MKRLEEIANDSKNKQGQINKIVDDLENLLNDEEYKDAADCAASLILYVRLNAKREKKIRIDNVGL